MIRNMYKPIIRAIHFENAYHVQKLRMIVALVLGVLFLSFANPANAEVIGTKDLAGSLSLSSYNLTITAIDDPMIKGVTCHISDVVSGGLASIGQDFSAMSIACRQTGKIVIQGATKDNPWGKLDTSEVGQDVFGKSKGWAKDLVVTRWVDTKRNVLIYVVHVTKWGDDSKKNVISTISLNVAK